MNDTVQEVQRIKKELVDLIVAKLEKSEMTVAQAQSLAHDFLARLPISDHQDLLIKLKELSQQYIDLRELYLVELNKTKDMSRDDALTQMRNAIAHGNIEHAIAVAKQQRGGI
jgi:hypothetical protein